MFKLPILLLIFATPTIFAGPLDAAYQEGLNVAQSNRQKSIEKIKDFNPPDKFKKYTDNPPQAKYYHGVTADNAGELKADGDAAYTYNEDDKDNNATQAALKSFRKNPKLKIDPNDPNDPIIGRAKDIMENAPDIAIGHSSAGKGADCKESKICRIEYLKKTCNEEKDPIRRVCEKIPEVTTYMKDIIYPNCRSVDIKQDVRRHCLPGYGEILYADMIDGPIDDDVRLCTRAVADSERVECLGGYMVCGKWNQTQSTNRATVPKGMHSRIRFSNIYGHGRYLPVTIINETTRQTLYNGVRFYNGQGIELPFSEKEDQVFSFYKASNASWRDIGVVILYIDHIGRDRAANITWKESCRDV